MLCFVYKGQSSQSKFFNSLFVRGSSWILLLTLRFYTCMITGGFFSLIKLDFSSARTDLIASLHCCLGFIFL